MSDVADADIKMASLWNKCAIHPGLVIILDVPFEVAKDRREARGGQVETFDADISQRRLDALYRNAGPSVCELWGAEVHLVDGTGTPTAVHDRVRRIVDRYLPEKRKS